jgi:2-iminobutanoate/2-iminopropanoate deaminase
VEVDGWVYVSGIGPVDPKSAQPVRGSVEDETRCVLAQMDKILQAAGCKRENIVKCTVHLKDINEFDRYNAVYKEYFKGVAVLPARTTVQSVLWNGIKVEIDCVAKKPSRPHVSHLIVCGVLPLHRGRCRVLPNLIELETGCVRSASRPEIRQSSP